MFNFFVKIWKKFFGNENEKILQSYRSVVLEVNRLEKDFEKLLDEEILTHSAKLKESFDLIEALGLVREVVKRCLKQRMYDVQLLGTLGLFNGYIIEMQTGEGKTLSAVAAAYLFFLKGLSVKIVTVNDYLSKRDFQWMQKIYMKLGMSSSYIVSETSFDDRRISYKADIVYITASELCFDYLRDSNSPSFSLLMNRSFDVVIIDEADSVLIDEARVPIVISSTQGTDPRVYVVFQTIISKLRPDDYLMEEKYKNVNFTDQGLKQLEFLLRKNNLIKVGKLFHIENSFLLHGLKQALRAKLLYQKNKDYIIRNNKIILIDEISGRAMEGRRLSNGLHQAIEAKEKVPIYPENVMIGKVTYQSFFRLFKCLSGMTGTAVTEAEEFQEVYGLKVLSIPPNVPSIRKDNDDLVFYKKEYKEKEMVKRILEEHKVGRPILIGTRSVAASEEMSLLLTKKGIKHEVLNAKNHFREAEMIASAGCLGKVTIITNIAGRGVDIKLGGDLEKQLYDGLKILEKNSLDYQKEREAIKTRVRKNAQKVRELGGILIIGSERHESRRIDNQLRGRAGRQGDPGETQFYLCLEDDIIRIFAGHRLDFLFKSLGSVEEGISHSMINNAILRAQKQIENHNYDIRRSLLSYDEILDEQRKIIYSERMRVLKAEDPGELFYDITCVGLEEFIDKHFDEEKTDDDLYLDSFERTVKTFLNTEMALEFQKLRKDFSLKKEEVLLRFRNYIKKRLKDNIKVVSTEDYKNVCRVAIIKIIDRFWHGHLNSLENVRLNVNLRVYAQRSPINEYKYEAFRLFEAMFQEINQSILFFFVNLDFSKIIQEKERTSFGQGIHKCTIPENLPRNSPCPCKSGLKFKHCHGKKKKQKLE